MGDAGSPSQPETQDEWDRDESTARRAGPRPRLRRWAERRRKRGSWAHYGVNEEAVTLSPVSFPTNSEPLLFEAALLSRPRSLVLLTLPPVHWLCRLYLASLTHWHSVPVPILLDSLRTERGSLQTDSRRIKSSPGAVRLF